MSYQTIDELLKLAVEKKASDLHLTVGLPPQFRIDGVLIPLEEKPLTEESAQNCAYQLLREDQIILFEKNKEMDTSYSIKGLSRFRVNVYRQRGSVAAAVRVIPFEVPSLDSLSLPPILEEFANRPHGLFIVSGPTGSGKSTTLAAMVEYINQRRNCHLISVEDPIEYLHRHKKATINQRELNVDTHSFGEALRHIVREDPNIILIGEMRDLETMTAVLTLAETGHLILTTLHTSDTTHAIHRIIDVFPPHQQTQIRVQLSLVLIGIMVQQLLPKASGSGRVPAYEMMSAIPAVGHLIRENRLHELRSVIQTGSKFGMRTMNQSLAELYKREQVTWEEITRRTLDLDDLRDILKLSPQGIDI